MKKVKLGFKKDTGYLGGKQPHADMVLPICAETGEDIEGVIECTVTCKMNEPTTMAFTCHVHNAEGNICVRREQDNKVASRVFKHKTTYDYGCAHNWLDVTTMRDHETGVRRCTCTVCGANEVIRLCEQEG